MDKKLRRTLPRQFVNWSATYLIEGSPDGQWHDCRVIDISSVGAGLELLDARPETAEGQRIVVAIQLPGEIRHSELTAEGHLRVGAQFVGLTDEERVSLTSLTSLDAHW
jgi:hypothetical protein